MALVMGLGAGLLGGVLGASLMDGGQAAPGDVSSAADLSDANGLGERVGELARATEALEARLAELELRPQATERAALADSGNPTATSGGAAPYAGSSPEVMSVLASQQFQDQVGVILGDLQDRERLERDQRRDDAEADRLEERLVDLTERLGLYGNQVDSMRTILTDERLARNAAVAKARDLGDWGSMRTAMGEVRETSNAALKSVLSEEQMTKYTDYQSSQGFGSMFGGGRSRGGDRGSGGAGGGDRGGR